MTGTTEGNRFSTSCPLSFTSSVVASEEEPPGSLKLKVVARPGYAAGMRQAYQTGGFEDIAGYSRGVRIDEMIAISATAATDESGKARFPGDIYAQTKAAFEQALEAVEALGGSLAGVLRTRMYLVLDCDWRRAVDAHQELFGEVRPANSTFYVAGFIPEGVLVEVELEAVVSA